MTEDAAFIRMHPENPGDWDLVRPYLASALERTGNKDWTLTDLLIRAQADLIALWGLVIGGRLVGAGATCETRYPQRLVVEVLAFGSDAHSGFMAALPALKEMAQRIGAEAIIGEGRKGWATQLDAKPRYGWEIEL